MHDDDRRNILKKGGALLTAGLLGGVASQAMAGEHRYKQMRAFAVDAGKEGVCATCRFWGGIRRAAEDKKTVYCESLGWCNNPESHNYQRTTTPITGPMKSWRKWEAL